MKHYILTYSADFDPRVPHFLKGALTPERVEKYTDVDVASLSEYWVRRDARYAFSGPVWFISRERKVDLDFYPVLDGFIASDRMIDIIGGCSNDVISVLPVQMVDEKGERNSARPMNFCQPLHRVAVCNLARMDINGRFHDELGSTNRLSESGDSEVVCALDVVLKENLPCLVSAIDIASKPIVISGGLAQQLNLADLRGVRLVNTDDILVVDIMPNGPQGYISTSPHWRLRSDLDIWLKANGLPDRNSLFDPQATMLPPEIAAQIEAAKARLRTH